MVIYGESIEEILKRNVKKGKEPVIGVGVQVVIKPFNGDKPFFYKGSLQAYEMDDLLEQLDDTLITEEQRMSRCVTLSKCLANYEIEKFHKQTSGNQLTAVFERDCLVKKLIKVDSIQEVQTFIFDPQASPWKDMDFYVDY